MSERLTGYREPENPKPADYVSGYTTVEELYAYLRELAAPERVIRQVAATRPVDGRQWAQWTDFEATWAHDAEQGLDILISYVG